MMESMLIDIEDQLWENLEAIARARQACNALRQQQSHPGNAIELEDALNEVQVTGFRARRTFAHSVIQEAQNG